MYYKDADYYYSAETSVNTSNADESQVALGGVQPGRRYKISVVAFTSKGEGPRSPDLYVTKGKDQLNPEMLVADPRSQQLRVGTDRRHQYSAQGYISSYLWINQLLVYLTLKILHVQIANH